MQTLARQMREYHEDGPKYRCLLTTRQLDQRDRILADGRRQMARFGRATMTLAAFANGIGVSAYLVRRYFCDLDFLLFEILVQHLKAIGKAVAAIPYDHPDRYAAMRAAYVNASRVGVGGHSEGHRLLLRDRHGLPADLAEQIETLRLNIGQSFAGDCAEATLQVLDIAFHSPAILEAMLPPLLDTPIGQQEPAQPEPAPTHQHHPPRRLHRPNPLVRQPQLPPCPPHPAPRRPRHVTWVKPTNRRPPRTTVGQNPHHTLHCSNRIWKAGENKLRY